MEKTPKALVSKDTYKYPWRNGRTGFRAVLANRSGTALDDAVPFCLGAFLGELVQEIADGMGQESFRASVHVPVTARHNGSGLREHMLHMELECDVSCREERADDEESDWLPDTPYADGTVLLTKLVGPLKWRSVRWSGMTLCFAPLDRPVKYDITD